MKYYFRLSANIVLTALTSTLIVAGIVYAGNLTAPSGIPSAQSYTLGDIYGRLTTNTTATAGNHSLSTTTSPAASFYTLTQIYGAIPTIDATKVLTGTTYLGIAGSLPVASGNTASASSSAQGTSIVLGVPQGYYSGASSVTISTSSANFLATNIASGVNLLGITGSRVSSALLKTGQTICYDASGSVVSCTSTGQDGDLRKGISPSYTDNSNGTITDNATGLVWQKQDDATTRNWNNALAYCNANTAALPGSGWRLPNVNELFSIVDHSTASPAINSTYFPSTQSNSYWTATTYQNPGNQYYAWNVYFHDGGVNGNTKVTANYVRCVRR